MSRHLASPSWRVAGLLVGLAALAAATLVDAEDRPDWQVHMERGKERAKRRDWEAAAAEFAEAARLAPDRAAPRVARGNARGELGRFAEARDDFARAAELDPDDPEPRYRVALACVALGDDDGYRRACADLLTRFGMTEDPKVASPLAYTCAARPKAIDAPGALVRWGEHAVPLFRGNERVLGAALYRAGRFEEAVRRLDESARLTTPVAWDRLFLAMAHHRLGHADEAREYLGKARRWIAEAEADRDRPPAAAASRTAWHSWNERAEVGALRREAEAMLGVGEGATAPAAPDEPAGEPEALVLFDGKSLDGWKKTDFHRAGEVKVEDGRIVMEAGPRMTGVTSTRKDLPTADYELSYEAMRLGGVDFFAAATFPVGESFLTFVNGGWGGNITGLSSLNGADASENETGRYFQFKDWTWYKFRVRVTGEAVRCWIDDQEVAAVSYKGRQVGTRIEVRASQPLGFATWESGGALRKVEVRKLTPEEVAATNKAVETDR